MIRCPFTISFFDEGKIRSVRLVTFVRRRHVGNLAPPDATQNVSSSYQVVCDQQPDSQDGERDSNNLADHLDLKKCSARSILLVCSIIRSIGGRFAVAETSASLIAAASERTSDAIEDSLGS